MADRGKVLLMTRLALLEKHSGKQIKKAENTSRIDLITNPAWRWGLGATLIYFAVAVIFMILNIDMILDAVSRDQTKTLIMIMLVAWLSLLVITVVICLAVSAARGRRVSRQAEQYRQMLQELERVSRMSDRYKKGRQPSPEEDDLWEEPSGTERRRRRRGDYNEGLDYRLMEVLEFEDDDYCYYVEAVPKYKGGRRG